MCNTFEYARREFAPSVVSSRAVPKMHMFSSRRPADPPPLLATATAERAVLPNPGRQDALLSSQPIRRAGDKVPCRLDRRRGVCRGLWTHYAHITTSGYRHHRETSMRYFGRSDGKSRLSGQKLRTSQLSSQCARAWRACESRNAFTGCQQGGYARHPKVSRLPDDSHFLTTATRRLHQTNGTPENKNRLTATLQRFVSAAHRNATLRRSGQDAPCCPQ